MKALLLSLLPSIAAPVSYSAWHLHSCSSSTSIGNGLALCTWHFSPPFVTVLLFHLLPWRAEGPWTPGQALHYHSSGSLSCTVLLPVMSRNRAGMEEAPPVSSLQHCMECSHGGHTFWDQQPEGLT